jgi:DNA-binding GntR family transcriptional regulator
LQLIDIFWVVYHDLTTRRALRKTRQQDRWYAHGPILKAIQKGDVEKATEALRAHFDDIKGRLITH